MAANSEVVAKQPRTVDLGAKFTPAAREHIEAYLQSFVSFEPRLGLLYSDVADAGSWSLVALGQVSVDELVSMYSSFGAVVCYAIDGVQVVVPQLAHIEKLDSGTLDFIDGRLHRLPPDAA